MIDREKVIEGLECCLKDDCDNCPCYDPEVDHDCDYFGRCLRGDMYHDILALLKAQEPRVMTLEEFNAHWQIPPQERKPIWEEWKIDNGKGKWKLYGRATGGYGDMWRCWTSRPTDEQREATPWN